MYSLWICRLVFVVQVNPLSVQHNISEDSKKYISMSNDSYISTHCVYDR